MDVDSEGRDGPAADGKWRGHDARCPDGERLRAWHLRPRQFDGLTPDVDCVFVVVDLGVVMVGQVFGPVHGEMTVHMLDGTSLFD